MLWLETNAGNGMSEAGGIEIGIADENGDAPGNDENADDDDD
jgi:hypothetical protein